MLLLLLLPLRDENCATVCAAHNQQQNNTDLSLQLKGQLQAATMYICNTHACCLQRHKKQN